MKIYTSTEVLGKYSGFDGGAIPDHILRFACYRGSMVHVACANYAMGIFPVIDAAFLGYLESFKAWFDKYVDRVFFVEKRFVNKILGYSGQPDFGFQLKDSRCLIIDIKTPIAENVTWKAQIASYVELANDGFKSKFSGIDIRSSGFIGGMCLQLNKDGKAAKAIVYDYHSEDFAAFLSALNAHRYFHG